MGELGIAGTTKARKNKKQWWPKDFAGEDYNQLQAPVPHHIDPTPSKHSVYDNV